MNPLAKKLQNYSVILGSQSPRRHELLKGLDIDFKIQSKDTDESFPKDLQKELVPEFVAKNKFLAFLPEIDDSIFLITADTVVILDNKIIQKPQNLKEAKELVLTLSGNTHTVVTGVCFGTKNNIKSFSAKSEVVFETLSETEVDYYVQTYKPLDKAGAYGVQEWIGYIGIKSIQGSYYNIMGLPVQALYKKIIEFEI